MLFWAQGCSEGTLSVGSYLDCRLVAPARRNLDTKADDPRSRSKQRGSFAHIPVPVQRGPSPLSATAVSFSVYYTDNLGGNVPPWILPFPPWTRHIILDARDRPSLAEHGQKAQTTA